MAGQKPRVIVRCACASLTSKNNDPEIGQSPALYLEWFMNEKPQAVRSPVLPVESAREAEELRLVAEIVLGHALEGVPPVGSERTKSSPARAGHTAGGVWKLTGRAIGIAQEAYQGAVAQMQRLTIRKDADIEADAREAIEEKALAEDA